MASDGSIIIDTKIDNSDAENGINKFNSLSNKRLLTLNKVFLATTVYENHLLKISCPYIKNIIYQDKTQF